MRGIIGDRLRVYLNMKMIAINAYMYIKEHIVYTNRI